eukprot:COSAG06_NODE_25078_length_645_cov_18.699634_1_plen_99_part_10
MLCCALLYVLLGGALLCSALLYTALCLLYTALCCALLCEWLIIRGAAVSSCCLALPCTGARVNSVRIAGCCREYRRSRTGEGIVQTHTVAIEAAAEAYI